jgi:type II restriction enzyme
MNYTSNSQIARVTTEAWVASNGYCLACDANQIFPTKANTEARDFVCAICGHAYELKSSFRPNGLKIVDGAYASMMRRIQGGTVSSFLIMKYAKPWAVIDLVAIHHSLITADVVQERPPLSNTARRSGWVGCNILIAQIPPEGRIAIISDGRSVEKSSARSKFLATERLSSQSPDNRNWSRLLLTQLRSLPTGRFTLQEAYLFEEELSKRYPNNHHIRAKIRQQLQVLRDAGLVRFEGRGTYSLIYP